MADIEVVDDVARSALTVRYQGPSVDGGRMDVRQLAPALLGLADAIQAAGRLTEPNADNITVEIKATERGSFVVDLDLTQVATGVGLMFAADPATALANVKALLFDPAVGVFRYLRLRRTQDGVPNADGSITFQEGDTTIIIPPRVVEAGANVTIRTSLATAVDPLVGDPGIHTCEVSISAAEPPLRMVATDALALESEGPDDDPVDENEYTTQLRIVSLSWDPDLSWRFDEGGHRFPARITDPTFYSTHRNDSYRNGDRLRAKVLRRQWDRDGTLSTQYQITEVLEHRPAPPADVQMQLGDITDEYDT